MLHKVHNFVLNYKFINFNENYFDNKILQDKLLYIYHKLNMKVSSPQIINTKKHTKTGCLSRVVLQYVINRKIMQFISNFYNIMIALEIKQL